MQHPDPNDPGAPVHTPEAGPAPSVDDVHGALAGVIDPELKVSITELGMVDDVLIDPDGAVVVRVALTTAGCPLRHQISQEVESKVRGLRGVPSCPVEYAEMTQEQKAVAMQRARFQAREDAAPTEVSATTTRPRGRERQGRGGEVVDHGEPRRRARGARPPRRGARRRHLGLQRPAHARRRGSPRRRGRQDPPARGPGRRGRWRRRISCTSSRWGSSSTTRAPRSCGADSCSRRRSSSSSPTCAGASSTTSSSTCHRAPATSRWGSRACSRRPRCSSSPRQASRPSGRPAGRRHGATVRT